MELLQNQDNISVRLLGVDKTYRVGAVETPAIRGVDFEAFHGEMLFVAGQSGCGKTTLLSVLCGTLRADAGEIYVLGQPLHSVTERALTRFRALHVGFVFQQFNLIPTLTVGENVSVPLIIQGLGRNRAMEKAREVIDRVGLSDKFDAQILRLSGGQQQRVAIARALVHDPDLIICDEPTSALDSHSGHKVMELLKNITRDPHRTVIVVTHDARIYSYADRMVEMEDGRIQRLLGSAAHIAAVYDLIL